MKITSAVKVDHAGEIIIVNDSMITLVVDVLVEK